MSRGSATDAMRLVPLVRQAVLALSRRQSEGGLDPGLKKDLPQLIRAILKQSEGRLSKPRSSKKYEVCTVCGGLKKRVVPGGTKRRYSGISSTRRRSKKSSGADILAEPSGGARRHVSSRTKKSSSRN